MKLVKFEIFGCKDDWIAINPDHVLYVTPVGDGVSTYIKMCEDWRQGNERVVGTFDEVIAKLCGAHPNPYVPHEDVLRAMSGQRVQPAPFVPARVQRTVWESLVDRWIGGK